MAKPLSKMMKEGKMALVKVAKDEKMECARYKMMKGIGIFLFGIIWAYFANYSYDVWSALPMTIAVMGVLLFLYGLMKKMSP